MNDAAFSTYRSGYIVKPILGNKINYRQVEAVYSFNEEDNYKQCSINELSLKVFLSSEQNSSKLINYAIKTMSLILGTNLNLKVDIQDKRRDKEDYALFLASILTINEMLERPMNMNVLMAKIISTSTVDKDILKEKFMELKIESLSKWPIEEEYIKVEENSLLSRLSNFETSDVKAIRGSTSYKVAPDKQLDSVYKYLFTMDEDSK